MLEHLRKRIVEALNTVRTATLSTYGPAEIQASLLPCEAVGMCLYLLLPATSDHLLNLETRPDVVVTTPEWHLRGRAVVLEKDDYPDGLALAQQSEAQWSRLVRVEPSRLHLHRCNGWGYGETIDIEL